MKNKVQLITYVDRLTAGGFADLKHLLDGKLKGAFGGVHPLPFFLPIDGADAASIRSITRLSIRVSAPGRT